MNTSLNIEMFKERYFDFSILLFIAAFFVLPTTKMVNNAYYVFVLLPAVVYMLKTRLSALRPNIILALVMVFLFSNIMSAVSASATGQFYKHIFYVFMFFYVLVYLADIKFFTGNSFKLVLFWGLTLYVFLSAVFYWVVGTYAFGARVVWFPSRMTGPIYLSIMISSAFLLVLPYFLDAKKYGQLVVGFLLNLFNVVFIVQSRSGLVAFLAVAGLFVIYRLVKFRDYKFLFFPAFAALAFVLFGFLFSEFTTVAEKIVTRADSGRFALWLQLFYDFKSCNLLLGCGPEVESTSTFYGGYPILHPHSVFFSLIWYTGLLTFLAFMSLCTLAIIYGVRMHESWVLYLMSSMVGLAFDGSNVVGNPDEIWLLLLLPMFILFAKARAQCSKEAVE